MTLLSLLIPTTPDRADMTEALRHSLASQIRVIGVQDQVKIHILDTPKWDKNNPLQDHCIGHKRNRLLQNSTGLYVAFIDSDDRVAQDYVELLLEGIDHGPDCCSLTGVITENGLTPKKFIHSDRYDSWFEKDGVYYRCVNHLNCIRRDIALQIGFPETMHGEDHDYSKKLKKSGLIKTEHWIEETIYYYDWREKK